MTAWKNRVTREDFQSSASSEMHDLAVTLNCGMGSSSLNAEVNALERLQLVRVRNSSCFGSKYRFVYRARQMFRGFEFAFYNAS
jgi:hypothetical protein